MANEKEFGHIVFSDSDIVSANDLLRLQSEEGWGFEPPMGCTCCSCTCHSGTNLEE
ncbi:MAG: hypothetical protein JO215_07690 [Ktedonobacteraceae bacterium]|nr:hypothetical protein [Ktedonobacteraceae bacterium]MBV9615161.1 hypothetical protein [Ktedonobacteraceae bacterium]MBV9711573.1 hypothetical protein [Ktedonobacteraceae bacterium]